MKNLVLMLFCVHIVPAFLHAQSIAINSMELDAHASAILDVNSTTKGVLLPRMTNNQMNNIALPANGLMIYNLTANQIWINSGTSGSPDWQPLLVGCWNLQGNAGTSPNSDFLGTTTATPLNFRTDNVHSGRIDPVNRNTFLGYRAGFEVNMGIPGIRNVGIGASALDNLSGGNNLVAIGDSAMYEANDNQSDWTVAIGARAAVNTTVGIYNTYVGFSSGHDNTIGDQNTAIGSFSLNSSIVGDDNVAIGSSALRNADDFCDSVVVVGDSAVYANIGSNLSNTIVGHKALKTGNNHFSSIFLGYEAGVDAHDIVENIGIGYRALGGNTGGDDNTAIGHFALENNTTGFENIALGDRALQNNTSGQKNLAIGEQAAQDNESGSYNISIGYRALKSNPLADRNIAIGDSALFALNIGGGENTVIGTKAGKSTTSGNNNVFAGSDAGSDNTAGDFNVVIGNRALERTTISDGNTAVGHQAGILFNNGDNNAFIGSLSDASAAGWANSTAVGYDSEITATNQVRIGAVSASSIGGYELWSDLSDGRYKKNIVNNVPGLDFITALNPVTYRLDIEKIQSGKAERSGSITQFDQDDTRRTGFIAQEVEALASHLGYDFNGVDPPKNETDRYGLRYAVFVAPLVQAVQEQQAQIERLKDENVDLLKKLEELERNRNDR